MLARACPIPGPVPFQAPPHSRPALSQGRSPAGRLAWAPAYLEGVPYARVPWRYDGSGGRGGLPAVAGEPGITEADDGGKGGEGDDVEIEDGLRPLLQVYLSIPVSALKKILL